jgi:polyisoprenoid-binding protein YceI
MDTPKISDGLLLATGTWRLEPEESMIRFRISALPPAKGEFSAATGELVVDDDNQGTATASIEVDGLQIGPGLRNRHLKSAHFFDQANHPQITFRSDRIEQDNDDIRFHGTLSIRGHERSVELDGKVSGGAADEVRIKLSGQINRRDFGVTWMSFDRFLFSDHVTLELDLLVRRV